MGTGGRRAGSRCQLRDRGREDSRRRRRAQKKRHVAAADSRGGRDTAVEDGGHAEAGTAAHRLGFG